MTVIECLGCGLTHEPAGMPRPAERNATGECFEEYGLLLARSSSTPGYRPVHQLVVDAYTCQHPAGRSRREVQSTALSLMTLCLFCEEGEDPADGSWLHAMMMRGRPGFFRRLDPPNLTGLLTHRDVSGAQCPSQHAELAWSWATSVWSVWESHHPTVREWNVRTCADVIGRGGRGRPRR